MARRILALDTPAGDLEHLIGALREGAGDDAEVEVVRKGKDLLERLRSGLQYDLIVFDYFLGDGSEDGAVVLKKIRDEDGTVPVVAVAEKGDVESAEKAIAGGATDFLVRGGRLDKRVSTLLGKIRNLLALIEQNRILGEQNRLLREVDRDRHRLVGESPQIRGAIDQIERVAGIPRPVLIVGERGTGKELVARAIHDAAGGPGRPFVAVNCAAFPDSLLESELFGHERGAFTGADSLVHGKFEQARGGTLFLDEIGNMSTAFQQKILRVVEYGVFTRVGGAAEVSTDARIIAATNTDLKERMESGEFLRDLYDRLSFETIEVPSLRDRQGDVDVLARHFLDEFMQEIPALGGKRLAQSALEALRDYGFPGNVRELKNIIERAAYRDTTNEITPEDIGMLPLSGGEPTGQGGSFRERVESVEKKLILDALEEAGGNKAKAARLLGLSYHQFRYYHQKYA